MPRAELLASDRMPVELIGVIERASLPNLDSGPLSEATTAAVSKLLDSCKLDGTLALAGLWLLAGELDKSHAVSQSVESSDGSYWHGIMHRREGDYSNAKYWFRRAGKHPVMQTLAELVSSNRQQLLEHELPIHGLCSSRSIAAELADLSESAIACDPAWAAELRLVAWWEWQLLFDYCWQESS